MAARMMLVGSLSTSAKIALLQRPRRSAGMNPSFLTISNPKPVRPNPLRGLGVAVPRTRARAFSDVSESDRRPNWQAEYRRRLGIGDSPVILDPRVHQPAMDGEVKINFTAVLIQATTKEGVRRAEAVSICGIARSSSGDLLGVTAGVREYEDVDQLDLLLFGLKAASNLAKELRTTGTHDGPVVYVSTNPLAVEYFSPMPSGDPEEILVRSIMRGEDLEELGRSYPIYCGSKEKLMLILPDPLVDLLDGEKARAGKGF